MAYQAKVDDEQYLDADAIDLRNKLESLYKKLLKRDGKAAIFTLTIDDKAKAPPS